MSRELWTVASGGHNGRGKLERDEPFEAQGQQARMLIGKHGEE